MGSKRKADAFEAPTTNGANKKQATETDHIQSFREGLFEPKIVKQYASEYAASEPYKHAVVSSLISDDLLRGVRSEILENIHFTPKETDIYKIHQSGDLANLSGLDASALDKLPSLLKLRDALYGQEFRSWLSSVTGAGALSGKKTDMAVNVYAPGCHLLCHDDVIGSRRVSYILYLTDPDRPWRAEWGGALRLYPTDEVKDAEGKVYKLPRAEWSKSIPPAWNQLSFFAVQPGESFHDVEEVYKRAEGAEEDDGGRIRMAISGWFHIPQEGEDGYEAELEESLAEKSSLQQLQGKADQLDEPQLVWFDSKRHDIAGDLVSEEENGDLSEKELDFLVKYMTPVYLTPDTVEELNELFLEESTVQLTNFLNKKFAARLKAQLLDPDTYVKRHFETSRPPHKHRYQYLCNTIANDPDDQNTDDDPFSDLLCDLLPSLAFKKWLALVTGLTLKKAALLARRFRRGLDYQLAQGYEGEHPQVEYTLCVTPTPGWGGGDGAGAAEAQVNQTNGTISGSASAENNAQSNGAAVNESENEDNVGGYELYMVGDEADSADEEGSDDGVTVPANVASATGAGNRRSAKQKKADPAVYQSAADDDDDGILFSGPASWNTLSIVLRDKGVLKFVKYVSAAAKGDRFDFTGCDEVEHDDNDVDDEDVADHEDDDDDDDDADEVPAEAGEGA